MNNIEKVIKRIEQCTGLTVKTQKMTEDTKNKLKVLLYTNTGINIACFQIEKEEDWWVLSSIDTLSYWFLNDKRDLALTIVG